MNREMGYYELYKNVHIPERWFIRSPADESREWILHRQFFQGVPVHLGEEPFIPVSHPGRALDYSTTDTGVSVLNRRLVALWERLGVREEIQLIPARVEGQAERYFILNTLRILRCVDEARSEEVSFRDPQRDDIKRWGPYHGVMGLKIDTTAVGDAQVFRPWGLESQLIVSERIKRAMEEEGITGARFVEV